MLKQFYGVIAAASIAMAGVPVMAQTSANNDKDATSQKPANSVDVHNGSVDVHNGNVDVNAGGVHVHVTPQHKPVVQVQVGPRRITVNDPAAQSNNPADWSVYWLGVEVMPISGALRSQLNLPEKQGVLVAAVSPNSPAEKAGLSKHDILLQADGKKITTPRDLVAAVEAAKESKIKLDVIRGGKSKTIEATPAKRPSPMFIGNEAADQADWDTVERWVESMMPGDMHGTARPHIRFDLVQPGAIVPHGVAVNSLPSNLSVAISRSGNQPAKIEVQRGADKWSLTENDLDKLPPDVRKHVERMLGASTFSGSVTFGRPAFNIDPQGAISLSPKGSAPTAMPDPNDMQRQFEKRFEEMNRRMEAMRQMIEQQHRAAIGAGQPQTPSQDKEPMLEKKDQ